MFHLVAAFFEPGDDPGEFLRLLFWPIIFGWSNNYRARLNPRLLADKNIFAEVISSLSVVIETL